MFCPQCGQQQLSEEVRFCSRCGLELAGFARLLASGETAEGSSSLTARQRGVRKGLLVSAGGVAFGVVALLLTLMQEDFFVLMLGAAIIFVAGLMRMLYAKLLEDDAPRATEKSLPSAAQAKTRTMPRGRARGKELPPARGLSAADYLGTRAETAEIAPPPSVTEGTTRLLEDERNS